MTWFFLALGAAVSWAVGQILVKKGFSHIPPLWNNIINNFLALFFWVPFSLWKNGFSVTLPDPRTFLAILASACLYQFFYYSISKGKISLTGTVVAVYPVITVALSLIFLEERLSLVQSAGVGLIIGGGVAVAVPERNSAAKGSVKDAPWFLWGLAGAFTIGIGDFLTKLSINRIGASMHIFTLAFVFNTLSAANYLVDRRNRKVPGLRTRKFLPTLLGICLHLIGALLFMYAFDFGKASLIGPVSSIYPALVAVLAVKFLGERVSLKHGIGIGVTVAGLISIGFGGS